MTDSDPEPIEPTAGEGALSSASFARAFAARDPRQARYRLCYGSVVGAVTALLLPARFGWPLRIVAGWDCTAIVVGALCFWIIMRHDAEGTRRRASAEDPGRTVVWAMVLLASAFSLFAAAVVLRQARHLPLQVQSLFAALCLLAVAGAWALTHLSYALRYAHLYYRDDDYGEGGLVFAGDSHPDYLDFTYFAFTVGMCFQASDVSVSNSGLRRAVLVHAVLSFAYNTAIIAVVINIATGLLD